MYFAALVLRLYTRDACTPPAFNDAGYAHAAILRTITEQNRDLGRALHDMKRNKDMTLAIVNSTRRTCKLRLAFLSPDGLACANALVTALSSNPAIRLGNNVWEVSAADLSDPEWGGVMTWADLVTRNPSRFMRFTFATPTAIAKNATGGGRFMKVFLDPLDVFSGMARRWRALGGPDLPEDLEASIHAGGCVVSGFSGRSLTYRTSEHVQVGFVGWVAYECLRTDVGFVSALNSLAALAYFGGVGYHTAQGMGAVRIEFSN